MKHLNFIQLGLLVAILVLAYFVYDSIMEPIRFNSQKEMRQAQVIQRLKDIRTAQVSFRSVNGYYTADFDTLVDFLKNGQFPLVLKIGDEEDSTAVIIRDTTFVAVFDSIFKGKELSFADSLPFIPFSDGEKFELQAGRIERSRVMLPVFEVYAANKSFLKGLNKDYFVLDEGLRVGSMLAPSVDGNWE
ncbi:MAG: hypothetical protein PHT69_01825 [Bacteroidales bacterium]|nr:hypothetical protein [Bacteroidales bacterium]